MLSDNYKIFTSLENRLLCNWNYNSTFVASQFSMGKENHCHSARKRKKKKGNYH